MLINIPRSLTCACVLALLRTPSIHATPIPAANGSDGAQAASSPSGYQEDAHSWAFSGASLSVPRSLIAATSVGHLAFFAGGKLQDDSYTDVVDIFDRSTNKWTVAHLSSTRSNVGAGSVGGRYALFAGGFDSSFKVVKTVDVYDIQTGKWSTIELSTPRASPRIADLGGTAAIIGGLSGDLQYLSKAVDYVSADLSIHADALNTTYPQFGLAIGDKKHSGSVLGLYTSGYQNNKPGERFNDFQPSNQTTVFYKSASGPSSSSGVTFSAGPVFPEPRWGAGAGAVNGIFAVGGGHVFGDDASTTVTDRVDIFDAGSGKWSDQPLKLSVPRDYPLVQTIGDYVVFLSGTQLSKEFDVLDTRTRQFVKNTSHKPALYTLRSNAAATTVDDCLLMVAGGLVYNGRNATGSVEIFDACKI
ncbi:hypothetical protein GGI12_004307 [Dipsacomyces acuminosporus]|nr:hypothetical protein GGI12_004307 [Dipsacomyces acuminosporus]